MPHMKSAQHSNAWGRPRAGQTEKVIGTRDGKQRATATSEVHVAACETLST